MDTIFQQKKNRGNRRWIRQPTPNLNNLCDYCMFYLNIGALNSPSEGHWWRLCCTRTAASQSQLLPRTSTTEQLFSTRKHKVKKECCQSSDQKSQRKEWQCMSLNMKKEITTFPLHQVILTLQEISDFLPRFHKRMCTVYIRLWRILLVKVRRLAAWSMSSSLCVSTANWVHLMVNLNRVQ